MDVEVVQTRTKVYSYISLLLLLGLIILRFPFLILAILKVLPINISIGASIFQNWTYLLTAIFIWLNREELRQFHLDTGAVLIFILAPILSLISYKVFIPFTPHPKLAMNLPWFQIIISLILFIALSYRDAISYKINVRNMLKWIFISVVIGILTGVIYGYFIIPASSKVAFKASFAVAIFRFFNQLNNAAVLEEPLFRGFIWGYLVKLKWKESWIWLLQAFLFMLGHIYYLGSLNLAFFIGVPVTALVLGLLVWKSKSIGTSMTAHALINTFGDLIAHYRW